MTDPIDTGLKTTPVYTNTLMLEPEDGMSKVVDELGAWITWKTSEEVTGDMILSGRESYTFQDNSELMIELGQFEGIESSIPMELKAIYVHDDLKVEGRQWVTEVIIHREMSDYVVQVTVNLSVVDSDHSAKPPILSRPRLMVHIIESCRPVGSTPGLYIRPLSMDDTEKFLGEIHNPSRTTPLVVISNHHWTDPPINAERMREQLLGLANLYQVVKGTDSRALEAALGRANSCYGDAIRIIWPMKDGLDEPPTTLILAKDKNGNPRSQYRVEQIATSIVLRNSVELQD